MESSKIQDALIALGYKLSDRGAYWQTNAIFRDGNNRTAIQIYKNTGVWKDYVEDTPFSPFKRLVEATLGTNDKNEIGKYINDDSDGALYVKKTGPAPKIEMEEVYEEKMLDRLLPHYKFYNNKGISTKILTELKGGLATTGQLNQRFVFPIFNELNQIHGFSGRDMANKPDSNRPKWKHIGKKKNWVYPLYASSETAEAIERTRTVILVESIGDVLSLKENGFHNCLSSFGLDLSSKLICALVSMSLSSVVIAFNNDSNQSKNRGLQGAIKSYLKLLGVFEPRAVKICLPEKNDFGDMGAEDFVRWNKKLGETLDTDQAKDVLDQVNKLSKDFKLPKTLLARKKLLES